MVKIVAVFENNLVRNIFAGNLDLGVFDLTDISFYTDRGKALEKIADEDCDIVFTDNYFSQIPQNEFFENVLKIKKEIKIISILDKEDAGSARKLFKMGVFDCVLRNELSSEYIYGLFLSRGEYPPKNATRERDEELKEIFWGKVKLSAKHKAIYRIDPNNMYVVNISILNYMELFEKSRSNLGHSLKMLRGCLNDFFKELGVGEFFYNHFAQIVFFFTPSDKIDLKFVVRETKRAMDILKSEIKCRLFAVVNDEPYSFDEVRLRWSEMFWYTKYYFLCDKNIYLKSKIENIYIEDFNGYESIKIFQQALNDFDKNLFDKEIVKLLDIRPNISKIKEVTEFFMALFTEIKKLEDQYDVDYANNDKFTEILRLYNVQRAVSYCQECVDMVMDSVSESSRMSIHIKKYLENHIAENVTLKDLAENFNFEYNYSSKYFNKIMGMSFKRYFTNLRLEVAKNLLKTSKHKCYEIAVMCGYRNYEHFSRMFYKKYNLWPKQIK